jgi:hypothetical protein
MQTVQSPNRVAAVSWRSTRRLPTFAPAQISDVFSDDDWATYRRALAAVRQIEVPFALGGGLAVAFYTGHWRASRDLDLYVLPQDAPVVSSALLDAGLVDYFDVRPYDRSWIFRAASGEAIVDVIWALANGAGLGRASLADRRRPHPARRRGAAAACTRGNSLEQDPRAAT